MGAPGCPTAEKARDCPAARGGRGVTASCVSSDAPQSSENEQPGRPKRSRYGAQHSASVGGGHVEGGGGDGSGGGGQSQRVHSHEGSGGVENADADAAVAAAAAIVSIRTNSKKISRKQKHREANKAAKAAKRLHRNEQHCK